MSSMEGRIMKELQIYSDIKAAKEDDTCLFDLIVKFAPLLKKYSYILKYEDAFYELQADFIELIMGTDFDRIFNINNYILLSYIKKSIYNSYLKRSKKYSEYCYRNCFFCEMSKEQLAANLHDYKMHDEYDELIKGLFQKCLTKIECEIINLIYYCGYNSSEISRIKHISRQAVDQMKNKALNKLYKKIDS